MMYKVLIGVAAVGVLGLTLASLSGKNAPAGQEEAFLPSEASDETASVDEGENTTPSASPSATKITEETTAISKTEDGTTEKKEEVKTAPATAPTPSVSETPAAEVAPTPAGEYLGFDIVTFRHDPTYYDETEEYVDIKWLGTGSMNMAGYTLVGTSEGGRYTYTYHFPAITLQAGQVIRVYSRAGAGKYNFGASGEIWADDDSEVRLYDANENLEAWYG